MAVVCVIETDGEIAFQGADIVPPVDGATLAFVASIHLYQFIRLPIVAVVSI